MLTLQIAAGIVLAAVVLKFWRQSLRVGLTLAAWLALGFLYLLVGHNGRYDMGLTAYHLAFCLLAVTVVIWVPLQKLRTVKNGPPPS